MTLPAASDPNLPPSAAPPSAAAPSAAAPDAASPTAPPPPAPVVYWGDPQMSVAAGPAPGYLYAGFWRRVAAGLIDGFLVSIIWTFGAFAILVPAVRSIDYSLFQFDPVTGQPLATQAQMTAAFAPLLGPLLAFYGLVILIVAVYNVVLWAWFGGTLGQRALGMEVRRESDGRRIGFWRACLRYLGYIVASIPFAIGIFWIGLDPRKQGWHDKIAGTLVIRRA